MKLIAAVLAATAIAWSSAFLSAQETKPVPKDSVRVTVPGCSKGYVFTTGPRTIESAGRFDIPEGMHMRMNGPKDMMKDIKAHEGSMIEIVGLMKKGQYLNGVQLGGGVSVSAGPPPTTNGMPGLVSSGQQYIDVESWRPIDGTCKTK